MIESVKQCRLGNKMGCFCENGRFDTWRRLPMRIKSSSSRNGFKLTILFLVCQNFLIFNSLISLNKQADCKSLKIRTSASFIYFAYNDPEDISIGQKRRDCTTIRYNLL